MLEHPGPFLPLHFCRDEPFSAPAPMAERLADAPKPFVESQVRRFFAHYRLAFGPLLAPGALFGSRPMRSSFWPTHALVVRCRSDLAR